MANIKILLPLILFFYGLPIYAQQVFINGRVIDSLHKPMAYANVMLHQNDSLQADHFALTATDGRFQIKAEMHKSYTLTVSYFGYKAVKKKIKTLKKIYNLQFVLYENNEELDEISLKYSIPVVVKKDTTTYNAGSFTNGSERSLKDILKKLPGVQVDNNGQIKVNGKTVTHVYVENKKFFNGNSKLAIENIPADAVNKIQAIDHFQDVSFMKSFEDSKKMILNVKLKEGKKNFIFGDAGLRKGLKKEYLAAVKTFYYSAKKTLNYIGTVNNINENVLTFNDLLRFATDDDRLGNYKESRQNYKFIASLLPRDYYSSNVNFHAIQGQSTVNSFLNTSMYAIFDQNDNNGQEYNLQTDLNEDSANLSTQKNISDQNRFGLGQFKLDYAPATNTTIRYNLFLVHTKTNQQTQNIYFSDQVRDTVFNEGINELYSVRQDINYFHRIDVKNAFRAYLQFDYFKNTKDRQTQSFSEPDFVPVISQNLYRINTFNSTTNYEASFNFKYYWILTAVKHLYPSFGFLYRQSKLQSNAWQILENTQSYLLTNFDNQLDAISKNYYGSLAYKVKKGEITVKSGFKLNVFNWDLSQYNIHRTITQVLPFLNFDAKKGDTKYKFTYSYQSRLPDIEDWLGGLQYVDFKTLHTGNPELDIEKNHELKLSVFYFDLTKGNILLGDVSYRYYNQYFTSKVIFDNFNVILKKISLKAPKTSWQLHSFYRKELAFFYYNLSPGFSYDSYKNMLNGQYISNRIFNYNMNVEIGTKFKKNPNIDIANIYSRLINNSDYQTEVDNWLLKLRITYQIHKFYTQLFYQHQKSMIKNADSNINNDYLDFKADYNFSDKSWYIGLDFRNLLNNNEKLKTSQTNYLLVQEFTRIYPRLFLLKLGYKF